MNPQETARSLASSERSEARWSRHSTPGENSGGNSKLRARAYYSGAGTGSVETCACTGLVLVSDVVLKRIGDCHCHCARASLGLRERGMHRLLGQPRGGHRLVTYMHHAHPTPITTKTHSSMLSAREESAPARRPDPKLRQSAVELGKGGETHGRTLHGAGPENDATEADAVAEVPSQQQQGAAAGPASPRRTARGEREGADHRSTGHDGGGTTRSGRLWQARQDSVQGLRSRPKNKGTPAEVRAETSATAGDTGDDEVAFTGGVVAPSPSKVVRGRVGKGVGHVRVFVAVVLGCAVLLGCNPLFSTHAGTHAGTVKECVSMVASPHAVRSLKSIKKGGESSGKSAPHMCSG